MQETFNIKNPSTAKWKGFFIGKILIAITVYLF
jgi:hypothetical protein